MNMNWGPLKIGVIIPTRGNRQSLLDQCLRLIEAQTIQPCHIELVNYPPESEEKDITQRYRRGYDALRCKGFDILFLCEDDDFYAPNYIETMLAAWNDAGRPDLFGTDRTIYYHLSLFAYHTMHHTQRSSAMSTMIKPDMDFIWCDDTERYTDIHLWMATGLKGVTFTPPEQPICIGMKHGVGMVGGEFHTEKLYRYTSEDSDKSFLKQVTGNSFEFYERFMERQNTTK